MASPDTLLYMVRRTSALLNTVGASLSEATKVTSMVPFEPDSSLLPISTTPVDVRVMIIELPSACTV